MDTLTAKSIDLTDLVLFLKSELPREYDFDDTHQQIIEEVCYLSIDIDFNKVIKSFREKITQTFPELILPVSSRTEAQMILSFLYRNWSPFYQEGINDVTCKFKLLPTLYWIDLTNNPEGIFNLNLSLLDGIILNNKVFSFEEDKYPFWINPHLTKKPLPEIKIELEKEPIPYLHVSFPAYSNLTELTDYLKQNYFRIEQLRATKLPFTSKRDYLKKKLTKMLDAYHLKQQGYNTTQIAVALEKEYKEEISFQGVDQLIKRLEQEMSRFR